MKSEILLLLLTVSLLAPVQAEEVVPTNFEIEIHNLVNEERLNKENHGLDLRKLKLQSTLIEVARKHSQDMLDSDFFDHTNQEGFKPADRVSNAGVDYEKVGENLFRISGVDKDKIAQEVVEGWIDSPGHYANMLTTFQFTGVGVATNGETYLITQVFVNADPGHLNNIGVVYDNDELTEISTSENSGGFHFTAQMGAGIVILLVILIGMDASRRNR